MALAEGLGEDERERLRLADEETAAAERALLLRLRECFLYVVSGALFWCVVCRVGGAAAEGPLTECSSLPPCPAPAFHPQAWCCPPTRWMPSSTAWAGSRPWRS